MFRMQLNRNEFIGGKRTRDTAETCNHSTNLLMASLFCISKAVCVVTFYYPWHFRRIIAKNTMKEEKKGMKKTISNKDSSTYRRFSCVEPELIFLFFRLTNSLVK